MAPSRREIPVRGDHQCGFPAGFRGNLTLDARRNFGDGEPGAVHCLGCCGHLGPGPVHTLVDLEQRRAGLEVKIKDLSRTLKSRHPAVVTAQQELDDVNQNIRFPDEARAATSRIENQFPGGPGSIRGKGPGGRQEGGHGASKSVLLGQTIHDDVERTRSLYNALLNQLMKNRRVTGL